MPKIVNNKTGFVANASDADWNNNVYDKNVWGVEGSTPTAPVTTPTAPTTPPASTIPSTTDLTTPTAPTSNTRGTFVTYDPKTGAMTPNSRTPMDIGSQGANQYLEVAIPNPQEIPNYYVTHQSGSTLYGVPKSSIVTPPKADKTETATGGQTGGNTIQNQLQTIIDGLNTDNATTQEALTAQRQDSSNWQQQAKIILGQVNELKNAMNATSLADTVENQEIAQRAVDIKTAYNSGIKAIESQVIPMTAINAQLGKLTSDVNMRLSDLNNEQSQTSIKQTLANAQNTYNYNSALIQYGVVAGLANEAQQLTQSMAQDMFNNRSQTIQALTALNQIEQQTADTLMKQAEYELKLSKDYGYTPISQENYESAVRQYGESRIWKDPVSGQSYLKPDEAARVTSTIQVDGHLWGINSSGEKIKDYGRTSNYDFIETADGNIAVTDPSTGNVIYNEKPVYAELSIGNGTITGMNGSEAWSNGLDFVLAGGKGADVKSPFIGEVIAAGKNGGFGNQVKIRTASGEEIWMSHLDSMNVKVGDIVNEESIIGKQGNTGNVYSLTGGDGTHLDITMKKPDGSFYKPSEVAQILGYNKGAGSEYDMNVMIMRIGKQVYGTRISDNESKRVQQVVAEGVKQGKDQFEIINDLVGFKIEKNQTFAENLRNVLVQYSGDGGLADYDMVGLASLINNDRLGDAVNKVEQIVLAKSEDGLQREESAVFAQKKGDELVRLINANMSKLGIVAGNWEKQKSRFVGTPEYTQIDAGLKALTSEWRNKMAGSAITPTEEEYLSSLLSGATDNPFNAITKLREFQNLSLGQYNATRITMRLPEIDQFTLVNKDKRAQLYTTMNPDDPMNLLDGGEEIDDPAGIL